MREVTVQPDVWVHRPTKVRAMQLRSDNFRDVFAWMTEDGAYWWSASDDMGEVVLWLAAAAPGQDSKIRVRTPQGPRRVLLHDWVVHGVANVWYPVHPPVWEQSYDPEGPTQGGGVTQWG